MTRTTLRRARKVHYCGNGDHWGIRRGDLYLEHVTSPGHEILNNEHWTRMAECGACAERYGRSDLLDHVAAVSA